MKDFMKWGLAISLTALLVGSFLICVVSPGNLGIEITRRDSDQELPAEADLPVATELSQCPEAPFSMPTSGWVAILYGDSLYGTVNHSGLDIFGLDGNGYHSGLCCLRRLPDPPDGLGKCGHNPAS